MYNLKIMKKLLLLLIPLLSFAHPHLFIDTKLDFTITNDKIEKLDITWVIDDMNSQIFMMDYDSNRDKKINKQEMQKLKKEYFSKPFTHINIDGKEINPLADINHFSIDYKKGLLVVSFSISFKKMKQKKVIELGFWDDENYTALTINRDHIKFKGKVLKTEMDFHYADLFVADIIKVNL